jgi:cell shape-determining protein MreC
VGLGGLGGTGEIRHVPVTGRQVAGPEVRSGALVYTSPEGEVPGGLPMGVIDSIEGEEDGLFLELRMRPFISLQEMETVAVLLPGTDLRRWLLPRAIARPPAGGDSR